MPKQPDTEYIVEKIKQIRSFNDGLKLEINQQELLKLDEIITNKNSLSLKYLRKNTNMIDILLEIFMRDILKSSEIRQLSN